MHAWALGSGATYECRQILVDPGILIGLRLVAVLVQTIFPNSIETRAFEQCREYLQCCRFTVKILQFMSYAGFCIWVARDNNLQKQDWQSLVLVNRFSDLLRYRFLHK
jgi:hypothetical protein